MKKTFLVLFLATILTSCGGGVSSDVEVKDSLATEVDSLSVTATDSTVAKIPSDSSLSESTK